MFLRKRVLALFAGLGLLVGGALMAAVVPLSDGGLKLTADDGAPFDRFGQAIAMGNNAAFIGAPYNSDGPLRNGSVYLFARRGGAWGQTQKVLANDRATDEEFGFSLAFDGSTLLVGAPNDEAPLAELDTGTAYFFTYNGSQWVQSQKITANDTIEGDQFGFAVDVDGNTAMLASLDDDSGFGSGAVYVFTRRNGNWVQTQRIVPNDIGQLYYFGRSIAIDGNNALISAWGDDSVYFYRRVNGNWVQRQKFFPNSDRANSNFGAGVALDGNTALIGAWSDDEQDLNSGAAYVFTRNNNGTWVQQQKLLGSGIGFGDSFGFDVALDGDAAVVGASGGSAHVFRRFNGNWTETTRLTAADSPAFNGFGTQVALNGSQILVGATADPDADTFTGAAYLFDPPTIVRTTPGASADDVDPSTSISVTFSEPVSIDRSGVVFTCQGRRTGGSVSRSGNTYTLDPFTDLPAGATCTLSIPTANVTDRDGGTLFDTDRNPTDGVYRLRFDVDEPPFITSTTPGDGAAGVALGTNISITLNERVTINRRGVVFACVPGGGRPGRVTRNGNTYTLNPRIDLPANATCTLTIPTANITDGTSNTLVDNDGNPSDGIYTLSFDTVSVGGASAAAVPDIEIGTLEEGPEIIEMQEIEIGD